ncbi:hypothetical protein M9979_12730 [Sphingomonas sp. RP10(2022)]|uniref:Uncharacterized protein n=1 Tax=Sphingomonas liriopis TaxID=2949094 RepID=A0A9X2HYG9_9SPHN|nr:hypothetical protein [Sphingomonas liriopis]MCP3735739.1 hypothetical protein [Sphingomonas liriopis]
MSSNDNHLPPPVEAPPPDAQGQAALLLVESLIHALVGRSVMTLEEGVEIVQTAIDVQVDVARAAGAAGAPMWQAHALLTRVAETLRIDIARR